MKKSKLKVGDRVAVTETWHGTVNGFVIGDPSFEDVDYPDAVTYKLLDRPSAKGQTENTWQTWDIAWAVHPDLARNDPKWLRILKPDGKWYRVLSSEVMWDTPEGAPEYVLAWRAGQ